MAEVRFVVRVRLEAHPTQQRDDGFLHSSTGGSAHTLNPLPPNGVDERRHDRPLTSVASPPQRGTSLSVIRVGVETEGDRHRVYSRSPGPPKSKDGSSGVFRTSTRDKLNLW